MTIPKNWERKITFLYLFKKKKKQSPTAWALGDELCPFTFRVPI